MIFQYFLGIIFGVFSSLLAWYILYHLIIPKIVFASGISKVQSKISSNGYTYKVKLLNTGKRDVIDIDIYVKYKVKGLTNKKNIWNTVELEKRFDKLTYFAKGENRILPIFPEKTKRFAEPIFPIEIATKFRNEELMLDDILSLGSDSFIRVYLFGYDKFSGSRRLFLSKKYYLKDLLENSTKAIAMDNNVYMNKK